MSVAVLAEHRTEAGRFAPGRSGNPAGRPKGARNKTTLLAEALAEGEALGLARDAIDRAKAGDGPMLRFLIDHLFVREGAEGRIALGLEPGEEKNLDAVLTKVLLLIAEGEIAPKQGLQVARFVAILARLRREAARNVPLRLAEEGREGAVRSRASPRPVSDLYFSRKDIPLPPAGEGGDPARSAGEGEGSRPAMTPRQALTPPLSRKREREKAPVSDLYFSAPRASRAGLLSTTARGACRDAAGRVSQEPAFLYNHP